MSKQLTRYRLQEGTVQVTGHFQDRSMNNFVLHSNGQMVFNIAVGRDIAKPGETLEAYGKRQMAILENSLPRIKLIAQENAQLGAADEMITGIQFFTPTKAASKPSTNGKPGFLSMNNASSISPPAVLHRLMKN